MIKFSLSVILLSLMSCGEADNCPSNYPSQMEHLNEAPYKVTAEGPQDSLICGRVLSISQTGNLFEFQCTNDNVIYMRMPEGMYEAYGNFAGESACLVMRKDSGEYKLNNISFE